MDFKEFRESLTTSDRGKVVDSLLAVELGLDVYSTYWQAHQDMAKAGIVDEKELVVGFLTTVGEEVGFSEVDFDKILAQPA